MSSNKKNELLKKDPREARRRWLKHPLIIAVVPVVIGALLTAFFVFVQAGPKTQAPRIEVDSVTIQPAKYYPKPYKISLSIRNTGNQIAIIRAARLRVLEFTRLPICLSQGDLPITGHYKANLPAPAKPGKIINIPVSQQVAPDAADKFQLLLRAPAFRNETVDIYRLEVSLLYDNVSTPVEAGDAIAALPFDPNYQYVWTHADQKARGKNMEFMGNEFPQISRCLISNAKHMETLVSFSGERSAALSSLASQMAYCCALPLPAVAVSRCLGGKPSVQPTTLLIGCDGTGELEQMKWSKWAFSGATGTGTLRLDNCNPNCAAGAFHVYHISIRLSQPEFSTVSGYTGWLWSSAAVTFMGSIPSGMSRTINYTNFAPTA